MCLSAALVACGASQSPEPDVRPTMEEARAARIRALASSDALSISGELRSAHDRARPAIRELHEGRFQAALNAANASLPGDPDNPYLHLVAGVADVALGFIPLWKHYERFEFFFDMIELAAEHPRLAAAVAQEVDMSSDARAVAEINVEALRASRERIIRGFERADQHLAVAERAPEIELMLCPAAWLVDWNDDGVMDGDDAMWEISVDADGNRVRYDDYEAQMPLFRFDVGDIAWLRAMIAFQGGIASFIQGYDWSELDELARGKDATIRLLDAGRVQQARLSFLRAIEHSERARQAYLVETDDRLEWLAGPHQQHQSFPAPISAVGYEQWEESLRDLGIVLDGGDPLRTTPLVYVLSETAWTPGETMGVDVRKALDEPKDLVVDYELLIAAAGRDVDDLNALLTRMFGDAYVPVDGSTGLFAPWIAAIDDLNTERARDRSGVVASRYVVRRRILFVN